MRRENELEIRDWKFEGRGRDVGNIKTWERKRKEKRKNIKIRESEEKLKLERKGRMSGCHTFPSASLLPLDYPGHLSRRIYSRVRRTDTTGKLLLVKPVAALWGRGTAEQGRPAKGTGDEEMRGRNYATAGTTKVSSFLWRMRPCVTRKKMDRCGKIEAKSVSVTIVSLERSSFRDSRGVPHGTLRNDQRPRTILISKKIVYMPTRIKLKHYIPNSRVIYKLKVGAHNTRLRRKQVGGIWTSDE